MWLPLPLLWPKYSYDHSKGGWHCQIWLKLLSIVDLSSATKLYLITKIPLGCIIKFRDRDIFVLGYCIDSKITVIIWRQLAVYLLYIDQPQNCWHVKWHWSQLLCNVAVKALAPIINVYVARPLRTLFWIKVVRTDLHELSFCRCSQCAVAQSKLSRLLFLRIVLSSFCLVSAHIVLCRNAATFCKGYGAFLLLFVWAV